MAVAGVVILYHPDKEVQENIESYLPHINKLYIADNTEGEPSSVSQAFLSHEKVQLIHDGTNQGIAGRLNQAAAFAVSEGHNWLLTMDQDSRFEEGTMQDYLLCAGSYLHRYDTAMFGVEYEKRGDKIDCSPVEIDHLITSGSIVNLNLFDKVGGFDEALFIDEVDLEYCYRSIVKGYKIVKFANIFLLHSLGNTSEHRSLKNGKKTPRVLHSPVRLYYMVRNYLYVAKLYSDKFSNNKSYRRGALLNRIKNNLLYGNLRLQTIKFLFKALADYRSRRMGKITL